MNGPVTVKSVAEAAAGVQMPCILSASCRAGHSAHVAQMQRRVERLGLPAVRLTAVFLSHGERSEHVTPLGWLAAVMLLEKVAPLLRGEPADPDDVDL